MGLNSNFCTTFQIAVKKFTGIAPAIFRGQGFFLKEFGIIPFKKQITTVIGSPIDVMQNFDPSQGNIDELHEMFIKQLEQLFEDHKHMYLENADKIKLLIE